MVLAVGSIPPDDSLAFLRGEEAPELEAGKARARRAVGGDEERLDAAPNNGAEPRAGIAYNIKKTGTVLRAAYARTFETPFNENLLLSSATGAGGLAQNVFGSNAVPIEPGFRNQFNVGLSAGDRKISADWMPTTSGSTRTMRSTSARC